MLKLKGITKKYGEVPVLKGINMEIKRGEIVGIVGLNGAGKSTLMRTISGATDFNSGTIEINKMNVKSLKSNRVRRKISLLNTSYNLYGELTVKENLEIYRRIYGASIKEKERVIDELEISTFLDKKVGTLSTGMRKRAEIACATMHDFCLLLMDEPTNGLDIEAKEDIVKYIKSMSTPDNAIVITSHNTKDIERLCDRVYIIREGEIIRDALIKDIVEEAEEKNNNWIISVKYENGLEELLDNVGYKYEINGDIYDIIVTDDMKKQAIAVLSDYELIAVKSAVNDLEDAIRNII